MISEPSDGEELLVIERHVPGRPITMAALRLSHHDSMLPVSDLIERYIKPMLYQLDFGDE